VQIKYTAAALWFLGWLLLQPTASSGFKAPIFSIRRWDPRTFSTSQNLAPFVRDMNKAVELEIRDYLFLNASIVERQMYILLLTNADIQFFTIF